MSRVKFRVDRLKTTNENIFGQESVAGTLELIRVSGPISLKVGYLTEGVYTCVCAAGAVNTDQFS
jgi:hypothetical protein